MNYETEIFGKGAGEMVVIHATEEMEARKETIRIGGVDLVPGTFTTLNGYFTAPIEYVGMVNTNTMLFYTGMANEAKYFYARHYLTENRFFSMFSHIAGRDFNFKEGKWK